MSRVARDPVKLSTDIEIKLAGQQLSIKGTRGALELKVHPSVEIIQDSGELRFTACNDGQQTRVMTDTIRVLMDNMVVGISQGFERKLQLVDVGYKAQAEGQTLPLFLGSSRLVGYELPAGIVAETPSQTDILIKGINKQLVGQAAAEVRDSCPSKPYKSKGVHYTDEVVRHKETKRK